MAKGSRVSILILNQTRKCKFGRSIKYNFVHNFQRSTTYCQGFRNLLADQECSIAQHILMAWSVVDLAFGRAIFLTKKYLLIRQIIIPIQPFPFHISKLKIWATMSTTLPDQSPIPSTSLVCGVKFRIWQFHLPKWWEWRLHLEYFIYFS